MNIAFLLLVIFQGPEIHFAVDSRFVSNKLIAHFKGIDSVHIKGTNGYLSEDKKSNSKEEFEFFKKGVDSKYISKTLSEAVNGVELKKSSFISSEKHVNKLGYYALNNDPVTGQFKNGSGILFDTANGWLGQKLVETGFPLSAIMGNFAFTEVNLSKNPFYTFEELIDISKATLSDDTIDKQPVFMLNLKSSWGVVNIWIDKKNYRPVKVESFLDESGLMANGMTVKQGQINSPFKCILTKTTYHFVYNPNSYLNIPVRINYSQQYTMHPDAEQESPPLFFVYHYDTVEPFNSSMNSQFVISSTAKNGTPFHIDNQPQIAYHLEEGQLVLSASHKLLNQISKVTFGTISFWHRLLLSALPIAFLALVGFMFWRWRRRYSA